jgi:hypothetical protein
MAAIERKLASFPAGTTNLELCSHPEQPSPTLVEAMHGDESAFRLVSPARGEPQSAGDLR